MHLFSGSSPSAPSTLSTTPSRPFSPAATSRRSFQLGPSTLPRRPGLAPRVSSLSAASLASSTESLPETARRLNGSSLKHELEGTSEVANAIDPLKVLEELLGPRRIEGDVKGGTDDDVVGQPATLLEDIDFQGASLEEFAKGSRAETATRTADAQEDFETEKDRFEDLHKSVAACDEVLKSVEAYLTSFQADLASVASEIESLQNRSISLNNRLQNRKVVEKVLGPEVETLVIPPTVVAKIAEGTVDEAWVKALAELEKRSRLIDSKLKDGTEIRAAEDVRPFINDLSTKAVERIRDFVVAQIKALRSPNINAQVIQQNSFLRYKDVFAFLARHNSELAEEITQAYVNTMRWYYSSHFSRYKSAIEKLRLHVIDQTHTIGPEAVSAKGVRNMASDVFSIGRRTDILRTTNDIAMPSHAAEDDKGVHYLEVAFRAFNLALVDNASAEYAFLLEFFSKQPQQLTNRKFNEIFQPVFDLGQTLTKQLIDSTMDAFGVLVCVRLNQHFAFELQRRKVPAVEGYINATNMLLWPRFQIIIDAHCESIRKVTSALTGKPTGSALSLTAPSGTAQSTAPHSSTQRYANFLQGILALSTEAGDDEPVSNSVVRLRNDFEGFLTKLSKGISEARKRSRFLYNNYSLICTIVSETEGKLADELKAYYLERRDAMGDANQA